MGGLLELFFGSAIAAIALFVLFVLHMDQRRRLKSLEERLDVLERERQREQGTTAGQKAEQRSSALARAKERAKESREDSKPSRSASAPPPLPPSSSQPREEKKPVRQQEEQAPVPAPPEPSAPPAPAGIPLAAWLEKVGMKPPGAEDKDANLIAWWSTRAGLGLGVIAAVFFGLYVNQNTVPWVRLMELVLLAVALFAGGCRLERKQGAFGRALAAGALGLFYVAAYASFGLPAMKVLQSPVAGVAVQVIAVGLMAGWGFRRRNEGVFGLSLVLGYVTSWFSYQQGVDPLPLVSLLALGAAGSVLFALRGWWSGLWVALVGSSVGLILLAVVNWREDGGPAGWIGLGSACLLTVLFIAALFVRRSSRSVLMSVALPVITSVGVVVGAAVTWSLGIEWEWYYGIFAVLLLATGWLWRGVGEMPWEIMWAKASVFVALFLIAVLDGPVRAYGLLAQAGSLAFLAQRRGWLVFDVGSLLALLVGWFYIRAELAAGTVDSWGVPEFLVLGFLAGALGIVAWCGPRGRGGTARSQVALALAVVLALGVFWTAVWRVEHDWAVLAALFGAAVFVAAGRLGGLRRHELLGAVFLAPMVLVLAMRGVNVTRTGIEVAGIAGPLFIWLMVTWAYCEWLARKGNRSGRVVGNILLLLSVGAVLLVGWELCGQRWVEVVLLVLAVAWRALAGRVALPDLRVLSTVPGVLGALLVILTEGDGPSAMELGTALLAAVAYWGGDLLKGDDRVPGWSDAARSVVLGLVLLLAVGEWTSGTWEVVTFGLCSSLMVALWWRLADRGLAWIAMAASAVAFLLLLGGRASEAGHWIAVAVLFLAFLGNGLVLAHARRDELLSGPKLASGFWGTLALLDVLLGLVLVGEVAGWTTAGWALGAVLLLVAGFWGSLRGYRVLGLAGVGFAILRLFAVDLDEIFWRIVAFGVTGALLVGIGYIYNRFHQRLAQDDLDWPRVSNRN